MDVDIQYPSTFDILHLYDKLDNKLMELPLCEVIPGDVNNVSDTEIEMKLFSKEESKTYLRDEFLDIVQSAFPTYNTEYAEVTLAKDQTKIRI